jgi:hypothetical protein
MGPEKGGGPPFAPAGRPKLTNRRRPSWRKYPVPPDDDQAAASWPRTFRYCVIVLTERLPALAALAAWLAGRR